MSDRARLFRIYGGQVIDVDLPTLVPLITAKSATRIVTVLLITFTPAMAGSGTLSFLDSLTNRVIGVMTLMPQALGAGSNSLTLDFGSGTPLRAGANLILSETYGMPTGRVHLEAVQKGR